MLDYLMQGRDYINANLRSRPSTLGQDAARLGKAFDQYGLQKAATRLLSPNAYGQQSPLAAATTADNEAAVADDAAGEANISALQARNNAVQQGKANDMGYAMSISPAIAQQIMGKIGVSQPQQIIETAALTGQLMQMPYDQRQQAILAQAQQQITQGRDAGQLLQLANMNPQQQEKALQVTNAASNALLPRQQLTANQREFNQAAGGDPERAQKYAQYAADPQARAYGAEVGKASAQQLEKLYQNRKVQEQKLNTLNQIERILPTIPDAGEFTPLVNNIGAWAKSAGRLIGQEDKVDDIIGDMTNVSSYQEMRPLMNELVRTTAMEFGGSRTTNKQLELAMDSIAKITDDKEAIQEYINTVKGYSEFAKMHDNYILDIANSKDQDFNFYQAQRDWDESVKGINPIAETTELKDRGIENFNTFYSQVKDKYPDMEFKEIADKWKTYNE